MLKLNKSRTGNLNEGDIDVRVLQYSCLDQTMLSSLGKQAVESRWVVEMTRGENPVEMVVTVDKKVMGSPEVRVTYKGEQVFPTGKETGKLQADFEWRWPFRGQLKGLLVPGAFQVRPEHDMRDAWYSATILQQREDGTFKVSAKFPNGSGGLKDIELPVVKAENLRLAANASPIAMPMCALILDIPFKNPTNVSLSLQNTGPQELITHNFARPTPPPAEGRLSGVAGREQRITFRVSKDRKTVECDSGYSQISHFLSGEVRAIARDSPTKLKKFWKLQFGPFAQHTIEIEKKSASSRIVALTVDGQVLCQCAAEDIESGPDGWQCIFHLVGEKILDWDIHQCNSDGRPLDTKTNVVVPKFYSHEIMVLIQDTIPQATIRVNDREYQDLADFRESPNNDIMTWSPESLQASFGLVVPHKVDDKAPSGLARMASHKLGGGSSWLFCCCTSGDGQAIQEIRTDSTP